MEKSKISINVEGGFLFCGGWNFLKSVSVGSTFIREMRVSPLLTCPQGSQGSQGVIVNKLAAGCRRCNEDDL